MDGDEVFEWYYGCFEDLRRNSSDEIACKSLKVADNAENREEFPIAQTVKVRKAMVIEPQSEMREEVQFALDVKTLRASLRRMFRNQIKAELKKLYAQCKQNKYVAAVFESGNGDLLEGTKDLLMCNKDIRR